MRGCVICYTQLPIVVNLRPNRIYRGRKMREIRVVNGHHNGNERMPPQGPEIPVKNDALACADSIELLHPSRVGMIACHRFKSLGPDETEVSTVFILPAKPPHRVAGESSNRSHSFHAVDCQ